MRMHRRSAPTLALAWTVLATACASQPADPEVELAAWTSDAAVPYRLLEKDDFQAATSHKIWGNVAHGAEICTMVLPEEEPQPATVFRAYMRPDCSFWNQVIGPLGRVGRLALLAAGVVTVGGGKQPDGYILQHEQVHFAIAEVAARDLTRSLARLPVERRSERFTRRAWEITVEHVKERNQRFDGETSGTYDPFLLEKWVRLLELEMRDLCGEGPECRVRIEG